MRFAHVILEPLKTLLFSQASALLTGAGRQICRLIRLGTLLKFEQG
jgi:hypothetical protein